MDAAVKPTGVKRIVLNAQPGMVGLAFQAEQDAQHESIHGVPHLGRQPGPMLTTVCCLKNQHTHRLWMVG